MQPENVRNVTVSLPDSDLRRLDLLAATAQSASSPSYRRVSRSSVLREIVRAHFAKIDGGQTSPAPAVRSRSRTRG